MLGISQDASHDEIKAAFTERALRLRPHRDATDDDAVERAAWRLQELNDAWEVLRDPRRRRSYDQTLDRAPILGAERAPPPVALRMDDLPEPATGAEEEPASRWVRWAPALVIALILLVVVGISISTGATPEDDPDVVTTEVLPEGTCVLVDASEPASGETGDPAVAVVDCAAENDGTIVAAVDVPLPCPPRTINVPLLSEGRSLCLAPIAE